MEKKITDLTFRVNEILNSQSKNESQITTLKKELLEFISSGNVYYASQKQNAENLLSKLENYANNNQPNSTTPTSSTPLKIIIPFLLSCLLIGLAILLIRKKSKKRGGKQSKKKV